MCRCYKLAMPAMSANPTITHAFPGLHNAMWPGRQVLRHVGVVKRSALPTTMAVVYLQVPSADRLTMKSKGFEIAQGGSCADEELPIQDVLGWGQTLFSAELLRLRFPGH